MDKTELKAVHERELEKFLRKLGVWESISAGDKTCENCSDKLGVSNVGVVFKREGVVVACCDKSECVQWALNRTRR